MKSSLYRLSAWALALALIAALIPAQARPAQAVSPDVVISQVYGGGGNSGGVYTNDFVELFNRGTSTVSLAGWSIQYTSASGTGNFGSATNLITPLSGSIAPGQYLLVQEAAGSNTFSPLPTPDVTDSTPINMSGAGGKVALANTTAPLGCNGGSTSCSAAQLAQIVDLVGWDGANFYEGSAAPATTNPTAVIRNGNGCTDTDNNSSDFIAGAPTPRNTASPLNPCGGPPPTTPPTGVGAAIPNTLFTGDPTLLTVAVTPGANPLSTGLSVACDLTAIGGSGTQAFSDDGTHGDVAAGDSTFSFSTTIATSTTTGPASLACTVGDAEGRSSTSSISLTVTAILPIGAVNGPVLDTDDGAAHTSPYNGQIVTIQGVVYEKTLQATSAGGGSYGLFIQNTALTTDGDPKTSDGLFVYLGKYDNISKLTGGGYFTPQVGDEIVLSGKVTEYYNMTEFSGSLKFVRLVRSGVEIDAEVTPVVANPPADLVEANRYWERLQGMRIQAPQGSLVLGGRNVFSPADAEIWVASPESAIAQRTADYERRAFRDAHPLDDNYDPANWDGNGYRILLGSLGIKAAANDAQALIAPARTFDTLASAPAGGLNYTYSKYRIEISEQPSFSKGPDPAQNNPPAVIDRSAQYSIVDYNLENLYDDRDNPNSKCDFNSGDNAKCVAVSPFSGDVKPPYDYVPASAEAYQARLADIATQIVADLHSPDILMVQEVENQDICRVTSGAIDCSAGDGRPDVLQDLALQVASLGGSAYEAAYDPDSSDLRGILPAYLYRTDRVQLLPAAGDPILSASPAIPGYTAVPYDGDVSNPKTLNAELPAGVTACETSWVFPRAPSVALFRVWSESLGEGSYQDIYAINNHFKSGPDSCVAHRTEQAKYNAALVDFIQKTVPAARIVLGGDLNVYPEPDNTALGAPRQLGALYDPDLGLTNLWDVLAAEKPEAAYSYVYLGMAQTLDQMFVNPVMLSALEQFRIAHINSDFPADNPGDGPRGASDHDPNVATFRLYDWSGFFKPVANPPALNKATAGQGLPLKFSLNGDQGLEIFARGFPQSVQVDCQTGALIGDPQETVTAGNSLLAYDPTVGQYIYTWKTDPAWAGACRRLILVLNDASLHTLDVSFKAK